MRTWDNTLDTAGITDPRLRDDYSRQRALVASYDRPAYLAVRLLLPTGLVPHVIAATAFMHHTDTVLDGEPTGQHETADEWEKEVRTALSSGDSNSPVLRALLHTISVNARLRPRVETFMAGARADKEFQGFGDEADYQKYMDEYSLPAFMLVASLLLSPDADPGASGQACRAYIDGHQRLDFVNDLSEDLRDARLTIPQETLRQHGVSRADLEQERDTPGTRAMLESLLTRARHDLLTSRALVEHVPAGNRSFTRALITVKILTAEAALAKGTAVLRAPADPSRTAALRMLVREYRRRGR
ncbi:squalene/phytoene synthase family protein [Streptomyces sp. UNOB3_S3]|uniref:phytoene/squalene synthase family protein n=1 Tax=Streptomyces sp. UNOB3_S3 TaxID=2871682 RepID=UPI001E652B7A|nr:squalene/phytoene synthase family protein [Streptomyces sp. UNOB3_S3]